MWSVHSGDYVEPLTSDLSRVSPSPSWLAEKRWKKKGKRRNTKVSVVDREKKGRGNEGGRAGGEGGGGGGERKRGVETCQRVKEGSDTGAINFEN